MNVETSLRITQLESLTKLILKTLNFLISTQITFSWNWAIVMQHNVNKNKAMNVWRRVYQCKCLPMTMLPGTFWFVVRVRARCMLLQMAHNTKKVGFNQIGIWGHDTLGNIFARIISIIMRVLFICMRIEGNT